MARSLNMAPVILIVSLAAAGIALWIWSYLMVSSPHEPAGAVNQLAASLLTGAVVSFAFVWLDHKQAARRDRDALLLQLSFTADLSGIDLRNQDLTGTYMGGKLIRRANLAGACLQGASFYRSDLTDADLARADLRGADFAGATLTRTTLVECMLDNADFTGANVGDAIIVGSSLTMPLISNPTECETK